MGMFKMENLVVSTTNTYMWMNAKKIAEDGRECQA